MRALFRSLKIPGKAMLFALAALLIVAALLVLLGALAGPPAAQAGYLAIMFLIAPIRALAPRWKLAAGLCAVAVAMLGFALGPLGLWPLLAGLVAVCLVQGLFRMGNVAALTRAPANLVLFAGISASGDGVRPGQVLVGTVAGVALVLAAGALPAMSRTNEPPSVPVGERLREGLVLSAGALLIMLIAQLTHFPYASWALVSLCLILAVEAGDRRERMRLRVTGTVAGAVLAGLLSLLPAPVPLIAGAVCAFLCLGHIRSGRYVLFVTFLTPALLLGTGSAQSTPTLALERVAAIGVSVLVALACTAAAALLDRALAHRRGMAGVPRDAGAAAGRSGAPGAD